MKPICLRRLAAALSALLLLLLPGCALPAGPEAAPPSSAVQEEEALSPLSVHFVDVGQGDATLILCDGEAMLLDAGTDSSGTLLWSYLGKQGVTQLTYAIGTHPDADHIGGLDVVLYHIPTELVLMPSLERDTAAYRDVMDTISSELIPLTHPVPGDTYTLGDATFTVLGPIDETAADSNNHSLCILLEHGENSFLFTGDAEQAEENDLLEAGYDLSADVYQVGHHGSSSSTGQAFLEAVSPTWAVISCGAGNRYGHPHWETMAKLEEAQVLLFRTDLQGTVVAFSDGETITWSAAPTEDWRPGSELADES